ncbi:MAG: universal stress protein [Candidatus Thorarchaeota archaeon]
MPVSGDIGHERMKQALLHLMAFHSPYVTVFHVVETPIVTPLDAEGLDETIQEAKRKNVDPLADWLRNSGYQVETRIAVARNVVDAIVEEVNEGDYAFVFMFKRRKKKLRQRLTGSVTDRVIRRVDRPVVTILI